MLDTMVKTAPAGSGVAVATRKAPFAPVNAAYDNLSSVARQLAEATQSNLDALARRAVAGTKKAKRA